MQGGPLFGQRQFSALKRVLCFSSIGLFGLASDVSAAAPQNNFGFGQLIDSEAASGGQPFADPLPDAIDGGDAEIAGPQDKGSDYSELMGRLESIESDFKDYQDQTQEAAAKAAESKLAKPYYKLNGRVHLDNWNFLDTDEGTNFLETGDPTQDPFDRWDFRRIRLELSGGVPNNMIWRMQVDFNNPANAEMKDVYLGFTDLPNNQRLLIGNQKRPIGLDHLNSSRHNFFAERPFAVETFNEDARRLGIAMYGHSDDDSVAWQYGLFKLENINTDGRIREDFDQGGLYGRLVSSPWYDEVSGGRGYLHLALAGSANVVSDDDVEDGDNDARFRTRPLARSNSRWLNTGRIDGATDYQQIALETILNVGSIQTTGEYFFNPLQRRAANGFAGDDLFFHGGYIYTSYYLTGEHIPYSRRSGTIGRLVPHENFFLVDRLRGGVGRGMGALGVGLRYDYIDLTDSDIAGGVGNSVTLGINWHWTAYSKLQTNMIWGDIADGGQNQLGTPTNGPGVDASYSILGFRYMIDF